MSTFDLAKNIHKYVTDSLKAKRDSLLDEYEPLVLPIGKRVKEAEEIKECLDKKKKLDAEYNRRQLELARLFKRVAELSDKINKQQEQEHIEKHEHRRLELE